jgi:hypothetical protein
MDEDVPMSQPDISVKSKGYYVSASMIQVQNLLHTAFCSSVPWNCNFIRCVSKTRPNRSNRSFRAYLEFYPCDILEAFLELGLLVSSREACKGHSRQHGALFGVELHVPSLATDFLGALVRENIPPVSRNLAPSRHRCECRG